MKKSPRWYIPEIKKDHDEVKAVKDGTLYRKENVLQVWWVVNTLGEPFDPPKKGRETWTFGTVKQARDAFNNFETT